MNAEFFALAFTAGHSAACRSLDHDDRIDAPVGVWLIAVGLPVFPALAVEQVPVAVAAVWLERNGDPPGAVVAAFQRGGLRRPVVEVSAQSHAVGVHVRRKSKGDVD